jgi:hypothetical protein
VATDLGAEVPPIIDLYTLPDDILATDPYMVFGIVHSTFGLVNKASDSKVLR